MAVNLTKPSFRVREFTPRHITDEITMAQPVLKASNESPEMIAKILSMPLSVRVIPSNKNTPVVISKTYNCKIPHKFIHAVKKTERRLRYDLFDIFLDSKPKPKPRFQFFRFEGTYDELKAYLAQNYPKCELVPATTVLRFPRKHRWNNDINQQYMQSMCRFLVAVDNVEYAYADAAAPYEDDITAFYNDRA